MNKKQITLVLSVGVFLGYVLGGLSVVFTGGAVVVYEAITSFQHGAPVPENTPIALIIPAENEGVYPEVGTTSTFPAPPDTYIYTGEETTVIFNGLIKRCRNVIYEGLPGKYVDVSFCNNP